MAHLFTSRGENIMQMRKLGRCFAVLTMLALSFLGCTMQEPDVPSSTASVLERSTASDGDAVLGAENLATTSDPSLTNCPPFPGAPVPDENAYFICRRNCLRAGNSEALCGSSCCNALTGCPICYIQ